MKKSFYLFILIVFCAFILPFSANATNISAKGAVLIECDSGEIAYGKNEHIKMPMASTTKIMTALVVLENTDITDVVTIEPSMVGVEGSSIYLQIGEQLTVEALLYALLLESANDAAVALAIHVANDIDSFAELMNAKANDLGLKNTHFTNPHGLDDSEHYTTAYELGTIAANAMKNERFAEIVSTYKKVIPLNNGDGSRVLINHNKLLRSYDGALGVKTGFTKRCGRCLVSFAMRDNVKLICVTLNAPNDWQDHKALLDLGFSQYQNITLATPNCYNVSLSAIGGEKDTFIAENDEGLSVTVRKDSCDITAVLEANRLISAPIFKGDRVGRIVFYDRDKEIGVLPLYAKENVPKLRYKKSIFERLFN